MGLNNKALILAELLIVWATTVLVYQNKSGKPWPEVMVGVGMRSAGAVSLLRAGLFLLADMGYEDWAAAFGGLVAGSSILFWAPKETGAFDDLVSKLLVGGGD